jgi:hypothetical protein
MHSNVSRFAKNYSSNTDDECGSMRCQSNASVESHFKSVKHNRLEGRLRVRPRVFIQKELQYVLGKLKETELSNSGIPAKTRRKLTDIGGTTERWSKRRRPTRYADPSVHGRKSTLQSGGDAQVERRRREDRGAEGAEGVGSGEGVYPLPSRLGGLGERRELPQRGPGRSPGRQRFWYILSMKERRWWHLKVSHFGSMIIGNFYYFSFF